MTLTCAHTLCADCAAKSDASGHSRCPVCRHPHLLDPGERPEHSCRFSPAGIYVSSFLRFGRLFCASASVTIASPGFFHCLSAELLAARRLRWRQQYGHWRAGAAAGASGEITNIGQVGPVAARWLLVLRSTPSSPKADEPVRTPVPIAHLWLPRTSPQPPKEPVEELETAASSSQEVSQIRRNRSFQKAEVELGRSVGELAQPVDRVKEIEDTSEV